MGLLRLFLALSVVVGHTSALFGLQLMPSDVAVKLFFIVSGFYMSLVLSGKYAGRDRAWVFYTNRFLRLYPAFFIAVTITAGLLIAAEYLPSPTDKSMLVEEISRHFSGGPTQLGFFSLIMMLVPNLLLIGSDLVFLFHHSADAGWFFTFGVAPPAGHPEAIRTGVYLILPPTWSIGIELWFYLLVPWLSRLRLTFIVVIAICSLAVRLAMGWWHPWSSYFFFPATLCFFLCGMMAHRFWDSVHFNRYATPAIVWSVAIGGLVLLGLREFIPGYRNYPEAIYTVLTLAIPFIFQAFKRNAWDRWIGNLSYPVYLLHSVAIITMQNYYGPATSLPVIVATLMLAILVNFCVEEPLELYRQRRAAMHRPHADARVAV